MNPLPASTRHGDLQSIQPPQAQPRRGAPSQSSIAEPIEEGYCAVSLPAMAGLLLGLASGLAFLHPMLWLVPLLAIGVCLFALRQIDRYVPNLTGRAAARIGLSLAVIFGVARGCRPRYTTWP